NYHNSYTDPYIALRIKVRTSLPISPSPHTSPSPHLPTPPPIPDSRFPITLW
ncbi:MAG: hypothetical protein F6K20_28935, partial [Moorea sp. SIO2C4]|nr:hypothetical protein [Moorena sp. SIO2C4]